MARLGGQDLKRLTEALQEAFPTPDALEQFVDYMNFTPRKVLARIVAPNDNLEERARTLIKTAETEGWLRQLVDEAVATNATPALQQIVNDFRPLLAAAITNHYKVSFMGVRPLVDRDDLRTALESLDQAKRRIVVVNGPRASGNSYTLQFIRYLREQLGTFGLIWVDLWELSGTAADRVVTPLMVGRAIVDQGIEAVVPEKGEEPWAAWVTTFCNRLTGPVNKLPQPQWIVLDSFRQVAVPTETLDLVKALAKRLAINLPHLRLVLLSYDHGLPADLEPDLETEQIKPITAKELSLFFTRIYEARKIDKAIDYTPKEVAVAVAKVLRAVDPNDPDRLATLAREVAKEAKGILES